MELKRLWDSLRIAMNELRTFWWAWSNLCCEIGWCDRDPNPLIDTVSELDVFGVIIGYSSHFNDLLCISSRISLFFSNYAIIFSSTAGHMFRTTLYTANKGGVAAGLGTLVSPFLVDKQSVNGFGTKLRTIQIKTLYKRTFVYILFACIVKLEV